MSIIIHFVLFNNPAVIEFLVLHNTLSSQGRTCFSNDFSTDSGHLEIRWHRRRLYTQVRRFFRINFTILARRLRCSLKPFYVHLNRSTFTLNVHCSLKPMQIANKITKHLKKHRKHFQDTSPSLRCVSHWRWTAIFSFDPRVIGRSLLGAIFSSGSWNLEIEGHQTMRICSLFRGARV